MNTRPLTVALEDLLDRYELALEDGNDVLDPAQKAGFLKDFQDLVCQEEWERWASSRPLEPGRCSSELELRERLRDFLADEAPEQLSRLPEPEEQVADPQALVRIQVLTQVVGPTLAARNIPPLRPPPEVPRVPGVSARLWMTSMARVSAVLALACVLGFSIFLPSSTRRSPTLALRSERAATPGKLPPYSLLGARGSRATPYEVDFDLEVSGPLVTGSAVLRFRESDLPRGPLRLEACIPAGAELLSPGSFKRSGVTLDQNQSTRDAPSFDPRAYHRYQKNVSASLGKGPIHSFEVRWRGVFLLSPQGTREVAVPLAGAGLISRLQLTVRRDSPGSVDLPGWLTARRAASDTESQNWKVTQSDLDARADLRVALAPGDGEPPSYRLESAEGCLWVHRAQKWKVGSRASWEILIDRSQNMAAGASKKLQILENFLERFRQFDQFTQVRFLDETSQTVPLEEATQTLRSRGFMGSQAGFLGALTHPLAFASRAAPRRILITGGSSVPARWEEILSRAAKGGPLHVVALSEHPGLRRSLSELAIRTGGRFVPVSLVEGAQSVSEKILKAVQMAPPRRASATQRGVKIPAAWDNGEEQVWFCQDSDELQFRSSEGVPLVLSDLPVRAAPWMPSERATRRRAHSSFQECEPSASPCSVKSKGTFAKPPQLLMAGKPVESQSLTPGMSLQLIAPSWARADRPRPQTEPELSALREQVQNYPQDRLRQAAYLKRLEEAAEWSELQEAAQEWRLRDPNSPLALDALAQAHLKQGNRKEGLIALRAAASLPCHSASGWGRMAKYEAWVRGASLDSERAPPTEWRALQEWARGALFAGYLEESVRAYETCLKRSNLLEEDLLLKELTFLLKRWKHRNPEQSERIAALRRRYQIEASEEPEEFLWLLPAGPGVCSTLHVLDSDLEEAIPGEVATRRGALSLRNRVGDGLAFVPQGAKAIGVRWEGCNKPSLGAAQGIVFQLSSHEEKPQIHRFRGPLIRPCTRSEEPLRVWVAP